MIRNFPSLFLFNEKALMPNLPAPMPIHEMYQVLTKENANVTLTN